MGDLQIGFGDLLVTEQKDVHVDDARSPTPRGRASPFALHPLGRSQQLMRAPRPFHLQHLVQESRLVGDAPGLGVYDAALTRDSQPPLTQPPAGSAEAPRSAAEG